MGEQKEDVMVGSLKKGAVAVFILMLFAACSTSWLEEKPFAERQDMEKYSQERYLLAVKYMEKGRYELARQQFSIASASAESLELKQLASEGYNKAGLIIKEQR